ncbi:hypothetical protein, partial [Pseudomonas sp. ICMP 460]|uniref:hypothetical protein n=1 Tax=Pseudomonas sp. ICMP 460 TaxID=1718917 RepID=UPI001C46711C
FAFARRNNIWMNAASVGGGLLPIAVCQSMQKPTGLALSGAKPFPHFDLYWLWYLRLPVAKTSG